MGIDYGYYGYVDRSERKMAGGERFWSALAARLGMPALLATPPRQINDSDVVPSKIDSRIAAELARIVGPDNFRQDIAERARHLGSSSYGDMIRLRAGDASPLPDAVIYPGNARHVLMILRIAEAANIAVVTGEAGSDYWTLPGDAVRKFRFVLALDTRQMDRSIEVDRISSIVTSEPGIALASLMKSLRSQALELRFQPFDPEGTTLSDWIAGGGNKFVSADDAPVFSAKIATPRGMLSLDSAAPDEGGAIASTILQSAGALGILTEASIPARTLRPSSQSMIFRFPTFASGVQALRRAVQEELPGSAYQLSDEEEAFLLDGFARTIRKPGWFSQFFEGWFAPRGLPEAGCVLRASFRGDGNIVESSAKKFSEIARVSGGTALSGTTPEQQAVFDPRRLRTAFLDRGLGIDVVETTVKWSELEAIHRAVKDTLRFAIRNDVPKPGARELTGCRVVHCNANTVRLLFTYVFPRDLDRELDQWRAISTAAREAVKAKRQPSFDARPGSNSPEPNPLEKDVMQAIKATLDPKGIINP